MTVWRLHLKNDVDSSLGREKLFAFCREQGILGVGWPAIRSRTMDDAVLRAEADAYAAWPNKRRAGLKAVRAMRSMEAGDLIWTRWKGVYYLCRVTGRWIDTVPTALHDRCDLTNFCRVDWAEIGEEDAVPGKVVASMRPAAAVQRVRGVESLSRFLWDRCAGRSDYPGEELPQASLWDILSAEETEELVLLYLQAERGLLVYTSTVKCSTQRYECVLTDRAGNRAYPQVKSGAKPLPAADYADLTADDPAARVYLFAVSQRYGAERPERIVCLGREELETFARERRALLPRLIRRKLERFGGFSGPDGRAPAG